ncbi:ATP-binding cassette domain-containing protein [Virgibacillus halodenitrificans]|uniref:ABC transporter ATP-binding protein n=1 Tax=Virgibacillus halodenitrificans TaxID=1482 RepID=UPI00136F067A|nr:ABC transporter ATP-binding protein [Virgibacillus halodenitrificans]MYL45613.1 ATP-binding cassette domain-containing protein [Virgibacillus halodenitrificans]
MQSLIQVNNVTKRFGKTTAVNNVSFTIEKGSTVAILGPNGAGKTTTISMMLGLLEPTEGRLTLFGKDPKEVAVRNRIGAMLQEVSVIDKLRVREVLELFRSYYTNPLSMEELISVTGLNDEMLKKWANKLSGGQKRRLGFALALAGNPDLLFFDEPTVGLDITARTNFWEKVNMLKEQGKTVIFTTHYLQEADDFSERIILFNNGEIIADGRPDEIKHNVAARSVSFRSSNKDAVMVRMQTFEEVIRCYEKDGRIFAVTNDTDAVLAKIFGQGMDVKDIFIEQGRLEEVFDHLTSKQKEVI